MFLCVYIYVCVVVDIICVCVRLCLRLCQCLCLYLCLCMSSCIKIYIYMHIIHSIYLNSSMQIYCHTRNHYPVAPAWGPSDVREPFAFAAAGLRSSSSPEPVEKAAGFSLKTTGLPPIWRALKPGGKCGKMKVSRAFKTSWPVLGGDYQTSSILLRGLGPRDESDWGSLDFQPIPPFSTISGSERHREAKII